MANGKKGRVTRCTTCRRPWPKAGGCAGCRLIRQTLSAIHGEEGLGASDREKRLAIHAGRAAGITAVFGRR